MPKWGNILNILTSDLSKVLLKREEIQLHDQLILILKNEITGPLQEDLEFVWVFFHQDAKR